MLPAASPTSLSSRNHSTNLPSGATTSVGGSAMLPPAARPLSLSDETIVSFADSEDTPFASTSWASRRNCKRAQDYFNVEHLEVPSPVRARVSPQMMLTPLARAHQDWPIECVFSPEVMSSLQRVVQSMIDISDLVAGAQGPSRADFMRLAQQAVSAANKVFGEQEALVWGDGFEWPEAARTQDIADFASCGYSLERLARQRADMAEPHQLLTPARVMDTLSNDNPHLAAVLDVARGVHVTLPPGFIANGTLSTAPPVSPAYRQLHTTVDKTYFETHGAARLAIVLPRDLAVQYVKDFHTSRLAWTTKPGKPGGRSLIDPTWAKDHFHALNAPSVRDACEARWGPIHNPTIDEVVHMILRAKDLFPGQQIILWLMDVKGAYTQLIFDPAHVKWMAAALLCGAIIFFVAGIFGWSGMPFAFDPVTRAIRWELQRRLVGCANIYVDDCMGATIQTSLDHDLQAAVQVIEGLMGPQACAPGKTKAATRLDIIGYNLDTSTQLVTIAEKNVLKALYGFMSVSQDQAVPFQAMEQLASWGSRYAMICRLLQPFTMSLHASMHRVSARSKITITPQLWAIVLLFRTLLALTVLRASSFARSFESFRPLARPPTCPVLTFDASLEGIGILIYEWRQGATALRPVGGASLSILKLNFSGKPQYQNIAELLGAYFAVYIAAILGCDLSYVWLAGDSISALTWAEKWSAHSTTATNVASLFVLQAITLNLHVGEFSHIEGSRHWRCDLLSREGAWQELVCRDPSWKHISPTIIDPSAFLNILSLCDPTKDWVLDPSMWKAAQAATLLRN